MAGSPQHFLQEGTDGLVATKVHMIPPTRTSCMVRYVLATHCSERRTVATFVHVLSGGESAQALESCVRELYVRVLPSAKTRPFHVHRIVGSSHVGIVVRVRFVFVRRTCGCCVYDKEEGSVLCVLL